VRLLRPALLGVGNIPTYITQQLALFCPHIPSLANMDINIYLHPWMKEEKGIRHRGEGAYLCCPVFTTVHFSLGNEGSSEYI
jgi:hypothetical protein